MTGIRHLNPGGLHRNPAFTQVISIDGPYRYVLIGGQNATNPAGEIVGTDIATQAEQVARNLLVALRIAGASFSNIVRLRVFAVAGHSLQDAFAAFQRVIGPIPHPPTLTVLQVAGLAHPDFLLEVEATVAEERPAED